MQKSLLLRILCIVSLRFWVKNGQCRDHLVERQKAFSKAQQFGGKGILQGGILKRKK